MAIDKLSGREETVHVCTSETCEAHMFLDGKILRCTVCDNSTTLKGWERAQQSVPVEIIDASRIQLATA